MTIALWVITAILALLFVAAGAMKVVRPYAEVRENMAWVESVNPPQLKGIGALEVIGALGLILPAATGIAPWLTPLAALGLFVMMVVATVLHVRRKESAIPSIVLGVIALIVAVGWLLLA